MKAFSYKDLLLVTQGGESAQKILAKKSDSSSQCQLALSYLFGMFGGAFEYAKAIKYFKLSSDQGEALSTLMLGLCYELGFDADGPNYSKAIEYYSKGYIQWYGAESDPSSSDSTGREFFVTLRPRITSIIGIHGLCTYSNGTFKFKFTDLIRATLSSLLPKLSKDIAKYKELLIKTIAKFPGDEGKSLYQYQDLLLVPLEVLTTAAGRDLLCTHLAEKSFPTLPLNPQMDFALGRCLIDDEDASDNDYIISGLRIIAGHDHDPLWIFRTGLWYEADTESRDLQEAALWYDMARTSLESASKGYDRVTSLPEYRIFEDISKGTAEQCVEIAQSYQSNRELANAWNLEAALRGDVSSIRKIEQMSPLVQDEVKTVIPFQDAIKNEEQFLKDMRSSWRETMRNALSEGRAKLREQARLEEQNRLAEEKKRQQEEEQRKKKEKEAELERLRKEKENEGLLKKERIIEEMIDSAKRNDALAAKINTRSEETAPLLKEVSNKVKSIPKKRISLLGLLVKEPDPNQKKDLMASISKYNEAHDAYSKDCAQVENFKSKSSKAAKKCSTANTIDKLSKTLKQINDDQSKISGLQEKIDKDVEQLVSLHKGVMKKTVGLKTRPNWGLIITQLLILAGIVLFAHIATKRAHNRDNDSYSFTDYTESLDYSDTFDDLSTEETGETSSTMDDEIASKYWKDRYDFVYSKDRKTGLTKVEKNGLYGFVDDNGKVVVAPQYDYTYDSDKKGMIKVEKNNLVGYIDKTGKEVIPLKYNEIYSAEKNGWRKVEKDDLYGFIDENGNEIVPVKYTYIYSIGSENGWTKVEIDDLKGFLDADGKEIVPPQFTYTYTRDSKTGLMKVEKKDKKGILDIDGKLILPCEYDSADIDSDGTVKVKKGGKTGRIDKTGKFIVPLE